MGSDGTDTAQVAGKAGSWLAHLFEGLAASAPPLLSALFVLAVGGLVAFLVGRLAEAVARNAAVANLHAVGRTFRVIVLVITALVASDRLGFVTSLVGILLLIAVAAVVLALAIAFGLGARSLAREAMDKGLGDLRRGLGEAEGREGEERGKGEAPEA